MPFIVFLLFVVSVFFAVEHSMNDRDQMKFSICESSGFCYGANDYTIDNGIIEFTDKRGDKHLLNVWSIQEHGEDK